MDVDLQQLLTSAAEVGARHRATVGNRPVQPVTDRDTLTSALGGDGDLQAGPTPPAEVVRQLVEAAEPGLVGTVGPRFFGFVIGGSSPAATAADILATGWDQCAYNEVLSPAAAAAERAAGSWAKQLLGLPAQASVGFVTGAQAANTVGLAVGRHRVLADVGWDVEREGLFGAPRVAIVASEERHATIDRAARLLGFGTSVIHPVPATSQGAIDVEALGRALDVLAGEPVIVCLQAGNVNTGACDNLSAAIPLARRVGGWVHVDGAFGLWAAASPRTAHLLDGVEAADSWGTDAHKWLNVPYDSGLAFCADAALHAATMSYAASYLTGSGAGSDFVLGDLTPESSRRARGFAVWAALRELGRDGVADLVDRSCALTRRMAARLEAGGATIHNDVVLNQLLVSVGDTAHTDAVIAEVQRDGTCWVGGTTWHGQRLIRVSVSNATTTEDDIDLSADAILRAAAVVGARAPSAT
ncbi:pyridoxal phosphate-dependent decarboxylase family protein [Humibacillus xanthopallidus]|uniref:Glutamate/tyrosine decarboxylase-like PLP-dependent enzyme n=1 Tax=Humibacillus xanthopallidus TaxID=412689 RepID=A0A543HJM7_9MICO|nr:aminotransferase class V-fold PLP-dependent enzyme [Humibacillus xanthopallidus]TQM58490.1 glutamate/tyrosine decarboxylase-like PLP-dependent enzyme [Humibacillus xanthopallidus]